MYVRLGAPRAMRDEQKKDERSASFLCMFRVSHKEGMGHDESAMAVQRKTNMKKSKAFPLGQLDTLV